MQGPVCAGSFPAAGRASSAQIYGSAGRRNGALALQRGTRGRRSTARRASSPIFKNLPSKSTNTYTGRHQSVFSAFLRTCGNTRSASEEKNEDTRQCSVNVPQSPKAGRQRPETHFQNHLWHPGLSQASQDARTEAGAANKRPRGTKSPSPSFPSPRKLNLGEMTKHEGLTNCSEGEVSVNFISNMRVC